MNLSERVRANIRRLIEAHGWAYGDLGWPRNYVSDVVNGVCGVSLERLQEFADRLRCDPADLCVPPVSPAEEG